MTDQLDMFSLPAPFTGEVGITGNPVRAEGIARHITTEIEKRDRVMDQLTETRTKLVAAARETAREMATAGDEVTSPAVVERMREAGYGPELARVDLRFMGPVFRRGWRRGGYLLGRASPGSHARAVAIWELDAPEADLRGLR